MRGRGSVVLSGCISGPTAGLLILVVLCSAHSSSSLGAAAEPSSETVPSLSVLTNELSRADLFKRAAASRSLSERRESSAFFNLYGPFVFPADTLYAVVDRKPRSDVIFGIDISHYTSTSIPVERLWTANVRFVYVKASQGAGFRDGKFAHFWKRLARLPEGYQLRRGAYHFLSSSDDTEAQVRAFLTVLAETGGLKINDMPPALDLEWDITRTDSRDRWSGKSPQQILDITISWLSLVEHALGRRPVLYTSAAWWEERIGTRWDERLARYPMWVADYSCSARATESPITPNGQRWSLWQFTADSHLATGFADELDATIFKGTQREFDAIFPRGSQ